MVLIFFFFSYRDIPEHKIYWNIDQWWRKNGQCEVKGYRYDLKYQTMQVIQILFFFIVFVSVLCIIYKYMVKKMKQKIDLKSMK